MVKNEALDLRWRGGLQARVNKAKEVKTHEALYVDKTEGKRGMQSVSAKANYRRNHL